MGFGLYAPGAATKEGTPCRLVGTAMTRQQAAARALKNGWFVHEQESPAFPNVLTIPPKPID